MAERKTDAPTVTTDAGLRTGWRFSPHVIVFGLTFVAIFYAAQPLVIAFIHAWWGDSYRKVEFVMDEWRPNEGYPYVKGHLAPSGEEPMFHLAGVVVDGKRLLKQVPTLAFEKGTQLPVWWSDDAPFFTYNDEVTNGIPVAALPVRPGWGRVVLFGLLTIVVAIAGFAATVFVAAKWSRSG